jgi:DNA-binding response OmpR family regulator
MAAHLNIVVVEDHAALREVIVGVLVAEGHRVIGVADAESVDDKASLMLWDLLIVDLNLPGEDGLALARRISASQPGLGIIMMTARTEMQDRIKGYDSGADIYLPKPVDRVELLAAVNAIARRRLSIQKDSTDPSERIVINTALMSMTNAREEVELTASEVALLCALARAPGQEMEAWQLLEVIGGPDLQRRNVLEVKLARIRKKLVRMGLPSSAIRPVRGSGYKLCFNLVIG